MLKTIFGTMFSLFPRSSIALIMIAVSIIIIRDPVLTESSILTETLLDFNLINLVLREKAVWPVISTLFDKYVLANNLEDSACYRDLKNVTIAIFKAEEWALSMLDAFGKPGANILSGNLGWAGSYTECLSIKHASISGKYCWIKVSAAKTAESIPIREESFHVSAICVPNSCHEKDFESNVLQEMMNRLGKILIQTKLLASINCVQNPRENLQNDAAALIAIGICCICILFVVVGTILDVLIKPRIGKNADAEIDFVLNQNGKNTRVNYNKSSEMHGFLQFLKYFSIISNCKNLFSLENEANTLAELNGLKVIGMSIIIFGHTHLILFFIVENIVDTGSSFGNGYLQILHNAPYCVELFFLVTAFLTFRTILTKYLSAKNDTNNYQFISSYIRQRYLRMLIVPGIILFVSRIGLQSYIPFGPFSYDRDATCRTNWWQNVLFISNWWPQKDQCFVSWWFMSASMQLHVIALIVIIPIINKKFNLAVFNAGALLIVSWCWVGWKSYQTDLPGLYPKPNIKDAEIYSIKRTQFFDVIYQTPIYHFGSLLIGMALGWIIFKYKDIILTKKQLYLGWILWSILFILSNYGIYWEPNKLFKSLHTAFGVTTYSLCIAWLIIICNTKDGGIVSSVLRWKCWLPLSKLSLTVFLTHVTVIDYFYFSELQKFHYSLSLLFALFMRNWVVSYAVAILVTLTIEMPINSVVDSITTRRGPTKSKI